MTWGRACAIPEAITGARTPPHREAQVPKSGALRRCGATAIPGPTSTTGGRTTWRRRLRCTADRLTGRRTGSLHLVAEDRFHVEAFLKSLVAPAATSAPGVALAAEMESRFEREEEGTPESLVRRRWEETVARGEWQRREDQRRRREEEAARLAQTRLQIALTLEKKGKLTGALEFYNKIAREMPDSEEGRAAAARVAALRRAQDPLRGLSRSESSIFDAQ